MDLSIAAILAQDGITTGAIYALLALALVLVFTVTRVIFIPQGEFVAYGALTMASLQQGYRPGTIWLLLGASFLVCLVEIAVATRDKMLRSIPRLIGVYIAAPALLVAAVWWLAPMNLTMPVQI